MLVALSDILASRHLDGDTVTFRATEDWGQGRTMFGGFLSALALVAMRDTLGLDLPLRALQSNFVGPVAVGEVFYRTRLLRQGKHVIQVQCDIYSQDALAGVLVGVFGTARQSSLPNYAPKPHAMSLGVDQIQPLPFIPGVTPKFLQHLDMCWGLGNLPYTGAPSPRAGIYLRAKDKNLSHEVLVVMLSDGPPTPALSYFQDPVMASSVSWSLELPALSIEEPEDGWFQIDMDVDAMADGYVNQTARLWTPSGQLASLGTQVVAVYG